MKETAKEVDKYTLEFLDKLKKEDKNLPSEIVAHLPQLRMSLHGTPKLRSVLGRLIYESIKSKGNWKEILPILSAIELYSISTYVLDDIFDNQPVRQNDSATWKKYGLNNAIIAGILQRDIAVKFFYNLDTSEEKLFKIIKLFEQADYSLYIGQYLNEKMISKINEKYYLERTSLLGSENPVMCKMIGIFCDSPEKKLDILEKIGRFFVLNAMMRNDFTNYISEKIKDKSTTTALKGKTFEDIRKGLWTYPIIHFFSKSSAKQKDKDFLLGVLGNWEATENDLLRAVNLLIKYGSIKSFVDFIIKHKKEAIVYVKNNFKDKKTINNFDSFFQLFENVKTYYNLMKKIDYSIARA